MSRRKADKPVYAVIPKGMFVFSKAMNYASELHDWERWFEDKGIACKIVKDKKGKYYLCRKGKEAMYERETPKIPSRFRKGDKNDNKKSKQLA